MISLKLLLTKIMTSFVSLEKTASQYIHSQIYRTCSAIDVSKADNDVTATQFPSTFIMADKNNKVFARVEGRVYPAGDIGIYFFARNYDTNGDAIGPQVGIQAAVTKNGTPSYTVTHPQQFREAIGITDYTTTTPTDFFTVESSVATVSVGRCRKYGKIVQIYISWTNQDDITVPAHGNIVNFSIGTLKSGFRPHTDSAGMSYGDNAGQQWYAIRTTGTIALAACEGTGSQRTIAAGTTFLCTVTFITP